MLFIAKVWIRTNYWSGSNLGFGSGCNLGLLIYAQDTQAIVWLINPDAYRQRHLEK